MTQQTEAPTGLYVFGTDNRIYRVKDASALVDVTEADSEVSGFGMHQRLATGDVPAAEGDMPDVEGHDWKAGYGYHQFWAWGWVVDEAGNCVYRLHDHPYATSFCIYVD